MDSSSLSPGLSWDNKNDLVTYSKFRSFCFQTLVIFATDFPNFELVFAFLKALGPNKDLGMCPLHCLGQELSFEYSQASVGGLGAKLVLLLYFVKPCENGDKYLGNWLLF